MNDRRNLTIDEAEEFASWFHCLADPTRVRILHYVAGKSEPITVGEIVEAVDRSQSTVSKHLQVLAADRFVFLETEGVRTLVTANEACMTALPEAAAAIMGAPTLPAPTPTRPAGS